MADNEGDPDKQLPECKTPAGRIFCPNMEEVGGGMDGEQYHCKLCGAKYYLDYDQMR